MEINPLKNKLKNNTKNLCEIGIKYAGMPGEIEARNYIKQKLEDYELENVRLEEFYYLHYMPKSAELELGDPNKTHIECEPLQNSFSGEAEGELIYAGDSKEKLRELAEEEDDLSEKIILTESPFPFFVYPVAEEIEASGVIIITDPPENLIRAGLAVGDRRKGEIPGVAISKDDGEKLKKKTEKKKIKVKISSHGEYSEEKSWNVIGEIPGSEIPEEKIGVCSHYDSQIKGEHAWDNVTGDAGLLEIARTLSDANPKRTIEILFFGVEELGFWGSTSFVKKHEKEVEEEYKTLINLDGFSSGLCPKNFLETTPRARDFAKSIASDLEWEIDYEGEPMPLSDHIPFEEKNVPIIWIHEGLIDPYYHTEKDTFDHIDFDKLVKITRVASRCAFELASIEELEFGE